jgi:uncharacterized protein YbaR (Trm112 family)
MQDHKDCPKCKTPLNVATFGRHVWKDCIPCNKKLEDIIEEMKAVKPKPSLGYGTDDDDSLYSKLSKLAFDYDDVL